MARRIMVLGAVLAASLLPAPVAAGAEDPGWVSVFVSGGIPSDVAEAVATAASRSGARVAEFHEGTVRLVRVTRDGAVIQEAPAGMGYPMSTAAVDASAAPLIGGDVGRTLAAGEVVFGRASAELRGARVGDLVEFVGWDGAVHTYRIGLVVPDAEVGWAELSFSVAEAARFGLDRVQSLVVYGFRSRDQFEIELQRLLPDGLIRVRGSGAPANPDFVLPTALIKRQFGEFAYAPGTGGRIRIDPEWVEQNIVTADLPVVGTFRCHRLVVPQLRGAIEGLIARRLDHLIDVPNFRIAGGCYNPRQTRGGDKGGRISRHAWGAAFDFNTADNPYGGRVGMDRRVARVFQDWGFAWGGNWTYPDGAHFEWKRPPTHFYTPGVAATQ